MPSFTRPPATPRIRAASALCALLLGVAPAPALADEATAAAAAPDAALERPRIGLVLGGGGAKGAAHIGVLKVLEELRVPVDCVAGTSMGALVGGAYAAGMDARAIEEFVAAIDWRATFSASAVRELAPLRAKREVDGRSTGLKLGLGPDGLRTPPALVPTQDVETLLRRMVAPVRQVQRYDDLPIPFRAVATDLATGGMVVLAEGDLPTAMRASMSVPGAFAPVEAGGTLLADGGLVRNLPVDVARATCADVVIAVSVTRPRPDLATMRSATGSLARTLDIVIDANQEAQFATLGARDVGIRVVLPEVGSADFDRAREAIADGEAAARAAAPALAALALEPGAYAGWRAAVAARLPAGAEARVAAVRIEGLERVPEAFVRERLNVAPGALLDEQAVAADATRVAASGPFESVGYRFEGPAAARTVVFEAREKSWGPTFLGIDYGLSTSLRGDSSVVLRADLGRQWANAAGASWQLGAQVGTTTEASARWHQPFAATSAWFVDGALGYDRRLEDYFFGDDRVARYEYESAWLQAWLGRTLGTWGELRAGWFGARDSGDADIGLPLLQPFTALRLAGWAVELERDTRPSTDWPTRGTLLRIDFHAAERALGSERGYRSLLAEWSGSRQFGEDLLLVTVAGGTDFGDDLPYHRYFRLGGPAALSSYEIGALRAPQFAFARAVYGRKIADVQPLLGMTLYAGVGIEGAWTERDLLRPLDQTTLGALAFVGGRTPIGPLRLELGYGERDRFALFLSLGAPVYGRWR